MYTEVEKPESVILALTPPAPAAVPAPPASGSPQKTVAQSQYAYEILRHTGIKKSLMHN
jgi:hypothetical protein